jgi:hypothetical protein
MPATLEISDWDIMSLRERMSKLNAVSQERSEARSYSSRIWHECNRALGEGGYGIDQDNDRTSARARLAKLIYAEANVSDDEIRDVLSEACRDKLAAASTQDLLREDQCDRLIATCCAALFTARQKTNAREDCAKIVFSRKQAKLAGA